MGCHHVVNIILIALLQVGDRAARRKRHSFHHELWHMIDYFLRGNDFEKPDAEWSTLNPAGFRYDPVSTK